MLSLVAEGSIPAEVVQLNVHGGGDAIAIDAEQVPPCFGIVAAKACGVLPVRREDVRPDVAGVVLQFRYGGVQVHTIRVTEQAMVTQSFCTRTCCDVFHVTIRLLHLLPVFLQRQGDERRGIGFCRLLYIVIILQQLFHIREVFCQLCDELLLLAGWRTVIRDDLHPLPRRDVSRVTVCTLTTSALDIRTLDDQSYHSSPSSQVSRTRCSSEMQPLVFRTFWTLSVRRRRSSSPLN